jgi:hypothetical protein
MGGGSSPRDATDAWVLYSTDDGESRAVAGLGPDERVAQWTEDGRLNGYNSVPFPVRLFKLDPTSGQRQTVREIRPNDPDARGVLHVMVTPDSGGYVYTTAVWTSELYLVEGL